METPPPLSEPPGTWSAALRLRKRVARPLERFLHIQASSGVVLLVAAAVALLWANFATPGAYDHFWHLPVVAGVGRAISSRTLHFWVNDGLMALFFFVVGLEIRREIHEGELSDLRRATLPVAAAVGGMVVPAAIYVAINHGTEAQGGWGVPMATDIAFAVGVLALLGKRVPPALRVLLLALAIIDDIGAIIVIALFYAKGFSIIGVAVAAVGFAVVLLMQRFGARNPWLYVVPGAVVWGGVLASGVHPTIAGVILGLLTPPRPWFGATGFVAVVSTALAQVRERIAHGRHSADALKGPLARIGTAHREAIAPGARLESALHPWVAFGIMPLFALANAGVSVHGANLSDAQGVRVMAGVMVGLIVGKPLGIVLACAVVVKLGWASLPRAVTWRGVTVVGVVAGIGFTMAIFVAGLAFEAGALLATAKLAVLLGAAVSIALAMAAGRFLLPAVAPAGALTVDDAEASTEE